MVVSGAVLPAVPFGVCSQQKAAGEGALIRALDAAISVSPGSFTTRVSRRIVLLMRGYQEELSSLKKEEKLEVTYPGG